MFSSPHKIPQRTSSKRDSASILSDQNRELKHALLKHKESFSGIRSIRSKFLDAEEAASSSDYSEVSEVLDQLIKHVTLEQDVQRLTHSMARAVSCKYNPLTTQHKLERLDEQNVKLSKRIVSLERKKFSHGESTKPALRLPEANLVNSVMSFLFRDPKGHRGQASQSAMRASTVTKYTVLHPNHDNILWDLVLGVYQHKDLMKASHLVPHSVPQEVEDFICGPGTESRRDTWENCLMLSPSIENHLNEGTVITVPVDPEENSLKTFKVEVAVTGVLDSMVHSSLDGRRALTLRDIDITRSPVEPTSITLNRGEIMADQGSDLNLISSSLVRRTGLRLQFLDRLGFRGLGMRLADNNSCRLYYYVECELTIAEVKRVVSNGRTRSVRCSGFSTIAMTSLCSGTKCIATTPRRRESTSSRNPGLAHDQHQHHVGTEPQDLPA